MTALKKLIGLTGIIGSGKSMVADLFRKSGCKVLDADQIGRALMEKGAPGWIRLKDQFGSFYFNADESLNRQKLRRDIFENSELRARINSLIHPLIRQEIFRQLANGDDGQLITVVEVPLLFEVGWQDDFDLTIVVAADEKTCLERLITRDQVDVQAGREALAAQMSLAEKVRLADLQIDNNGSIEETARQVQEIVEKLKKVPC